LNEQNNASWRRLRTIAAQERPDPGICQHGQGLRSTKKGVFDDVCEREGKAGRSRNDQRKGEGKRRNLTRAVEIACDSRELPQLKANEISAAVQAMMPH